ncbi:hypothetical protein Ga0074812_14331 [Parafrankia irregularis]|uniref:Thymidylate kinase n=1 Tax=Parafrankia irregularis TaxID=795642 RepID=A0A0S4R137_9ACTN|nr:MULTISPECIES: hypothetical protein [Frankiaceae]KPM53151.1 hypothetical protein ACG83_27730 [Frankia sp. R43]CUU60614.1 hypothetical protein Ga0074812_14331 [Parafrankia irregularis]
MVILEADPGIIARRFSDRGAHNRFQRTPGSSHAEAHVYRQATDRLIQAGFDVLRVECGQRPPEAAAVITTTSRPSAHQQRKLRANRREQQEPGPMAGCAGWRL